MHVRHVVNKNNASCVSVFLLGLLTLTSGREGWWGVGGEAEGGGGSAGARSKLQTSAADRLLREGTSELCDSARLHCTVRTGCQMALKNFFQGCHSILSGERQQCTTACQHALVSLLTTEDGAGLAFINCNCSGHQVCEDRKRRVLVCQRRVLDSMDLVRDRQATLSCSLARWICEADTSCLAALQYYVQHCSKLFTGTRCTAKCRNSVNILYRQPNAHKLRSCRCEGDEDYDCPSLVTNTERLCLQRQRPHHRHQHHNQSSRHRHHNNNHNDNNNRRLRLRGDDHDEQDFRQPGRRPPTSAGSSQSHTSGRTSSSLAVSQLPSAGPQTEHRRRKRRNKPRRNKDRTKIRRIASSEDLRNRHANNNKERRTAGWTGRVKVKGKVRRGRKRRGRRGPCSGRRGRKKRRSDKKGRPRVKARKCPRKNRAAKQKPGQLQRKKVREGHAARRKSRTAVKPD